MRNLSAKTIKALQERLAKIDSPLAIECLKILSGEIIIDKTMARTHHPLYNTWLGIKMRCEYKGNDSYPSYGAKGIRLCERWFEFWNFVKDMGPRPSPVHSVDRIDNKKGYSPDNCRWATIEEQNRNKRTFYECLAGHPWTPESTKYSISKKGKKTRSCLTCYNIKKQKIAAV